MQPNLPDKKQVMDALLEQASSVFVHLDPRRAKVVVPPQFRKQPMLVLEIGTNMRVPIPDLEFDDEGIGCTLSFGGRPYWCRMPWSAVFALVTSEQRGMVWPPDVPPEVADRFAPPPAAAQPKSKPAGPRLVSVSDEPEKQEDEEPTEAPAAASPAPAPVAQLKREEKSEPSSGGNAAAVLDDTPDEPDEPTEDAPKRKLPSYLRVVK